MYTARIQKKHKKDPVMNTDLQQKILNVPFYTH